MSTDGGRAAGGNRSRKISGDSGYVADYTPQGAMAMVDQATIDAFKRQNPNLPFNDPKGYYDWMTGGGFVVGSSDPAQDKSQYYMPNIPGQIVNQPLNSQTDKSFLQGGAAGAWMLPLMVAGAGVADMGGLSNAFTPAPAASTTPDLSWAANLTDAAGGSLANPTTAGSAYAGLTPAADPFLNPDVMNNMTGPTAQFPTDAVNGANGLPIDPFNNPDVMNNMTGPNADFPTDAVNGANGMPIPSTIPSTTPGITPQAVQQMLSAGMALPDILKAIQSGIGIASGLDTVFNPTQAVDPAMIDALWRAGRQTYQTSLDPQGDLYKRTLQQIQDQARASSSAHGVAMSPFAAGTENKATSDFNIDWNNKQLDRQVAGTGAFAGAGNTAANAGVANNAQAFMQNQVGTNALTTGVGTLGDWLKNIWGAGSTPNPVAGSTPTGGFNMDYFSKPVQQPGMYYAS